MRIGICAGPHKIKEVAEAGFDYIEFSLCSIMELQDEEFENLQKQVERFSIRSEAFNGFIPAGLKVTGPYADKSDFRVYLEKAISRACILGGKVIVFGSGASRKVPEGWPVDQAYEQFVCAAAMAGEVAGRYGITIAIEHLNRNETNIINTVEEAQKAAQDAKSPNVLVLVDSYHMHVEHEDYGILKNLQHWISHVHIARGEGRQYPLDEGEDRYVEFFSNLRAAGYDNRVSVEGRCIDFSNESRRALELLRKLSEV
jgi:sugar phosphate isomerase/epimerase